MISRRQIIESQQELFENETQRRQPTNGATGYHLASNDNVLMKNKKRATGKKNDPSPNGQISRDASHEKSRGNPFRQLNSSQVAAAGEVAPRSGGNKFSKLGPPVANSAAVGQRSHSSALKEAMGVFNQTTRYPEDDEEELEDEEELIDEEQDGKNARAPQLRRDMMGVVSGNNPLHEDYTRHFDPYSVYGEEDEEEDVWYSEERLYEDHLQEIVDKWLAIDDEIWAKIICMERNRRIAKAYARKRSLTVNGSEDEYLDGTTLGLNSFDNPDRDIKTRHIKQYIGQGLRIKITQSGDIIVRRLSKANIFVHQLNPTSNSSDHTRGSNSSSDPYALNSESGDLYGIVGLNYRPSNQGNNSSAFSLASSSATTSTAYPFNGGGGARGGGQGLATRQQQFKLQSRFDEHKPLASDGSSSSSGVVSYSNGKMSNHAKLTNGNSKAGSSSYAEAGYSTMALEYNRPMKIFNMSEFKAILEHESQRPRPNRKFLQSQCISVISFVVDDHKMLNLPSWIMIINIVAVDLLKTELGLFGAHDLFGGPMMMAPVDAEINRFGHGIGGLGDAMCTNSSPPLPPPLELPGLRSARNGSQQNHNHLAASKKAFANAAALGAYNGEHYAPKSTGALELEQQRAAGDQDGNGRRYGPKKGDAAAANNRKADSDGELQTRRLANNAGRLISGDKLSKGQQQSSSSSGFNSHCSSQNDSSAASSSSNIAGCQANGSEPANLRRQASSEVVAADLTKSPTKVLMQGTYAGAAATDNESNCLDAMDGMVDDLAFELAVGGINKMQTAASQPRGKRPPKLPHRVSPPSQVGSGLSGPIPIPAPPTEPSGKANLILVSPTGLSPPLPKRKGSKLASGNNNKLAYSCGQLYDAQELGDTIQTKENKDNCEELNRGQISIKASKLPNGIPAHAQLAPPATQRHILKYLLSATGKLGGGIQNVRQPPSRYQRPLPIVPSQKVGHHFMNREQHDESLYYCGLQARVPNRTRQALQQQPPQQVSKSAINAILMDHNNMQQHHFQRQQQQRHYLNPHLRSQYSIANQQDPQLLHMKPDYIDVRTNYHPRSGVLPNNRPFMKFLKQSTKNNDNTLAKTSLNQAKSDRNMFSSVDNLNQLNCQKPATPSFLSQMGLAFSRNGLRPLKPRSSKSKK